MKEISNFTKLTLVLILYWKTKLTLIRGVSVKKQLILHWKANMILILGQLFSFKCNTCFGTEGILDIVLPCMPWT